MSVVIPVYNDARPLAKLLSDLRSFSFRDVVVVDGGSEDDPERSILDERLIKSELGRGTQILKGIKRTTGSWIWILHADTKVSNQCVLALENALRTHRWGRFDVSLTNPGVIYRLIAWLMNIRSNLVSVCTGDQGMFFERQLLEKSGGFPPQPFLEDIQVSKQLRKFAKPARIKVPLVTSSRKWETEGVWSTILRMNAIRMRYFFGARPEDLQSMYYRRQRD